MLDTKLLREQPDTIRQALQQRGGGAMAEFEQALALDQKWRAALAELETLRTKRNRLSEDIGRLKREKKDAGDLMAEVDSIKTTMKSLEEKEGGLRADTEALLLRLPNIPDATVPRGASAQDNVVARQWGEAPRFDFKPKDHHELGTQLGLIDFAAAAKISGARFAMFTGAGARLERAIANFMLDLHTQEHGYTEILPPFLVTGPSMTNTGQLPKFADELYRCKDDDLYLIPTSEVPLANIMADTLVSADELPKAVTALTPCFRREAGAYGKDTRGLIRNHQFNKVELVRFCRMDDSLKELETLTSHAEEVLKRLELPYRVLTLCTGDMGFASAKTYDLEVWMPGDNVYREISSCSTCGDFQARRMNFKMTVDKKREFGCTLNGSGLAVGRTWAAVLENGQQADGSVKIPKALQPYTGFDVIKPRP